MTESSLRRPFTSRDISKFENSEALRAERAEASDGRYGGSETRTAFCKVY